MDIQFIKAPDGGEMVVLPRAEFDKLQDAIENIEDVNAVRDFQRKLAAGEEELIPSEIANGLIAGENPIRVWRDYREFKAGELAANAGVS